MAASYLIQLRLLVPAERFELPTNGLQIGRDANRGEPVSTDENCERLFCLKIL
jgi:hypothetical protein